MEISMKLVITWNVILTYIYKLVMHIKQYQEYVCFLPLNTKISKILFSSKTK